MSLVPQASSVSHPDDFTPSPTSHLTPLNTRKNLHAAATPLRSTLRDLGPGLQDLPGHRRHEARDARDRRPGEGGDPKCRWTTDAGRTGGRRAQAEGWKARAGGGLGGKGAGFDWRFWAVKVSSSLW